MSKNHNAEIIAFVDRLAQTGSNYRVDEMEELYSVDLGFLYLTRDGTVTRISRAEMFAEFRARRDSGEAPLLTEKRILHLEERGDDATVILYRRMSQETDALFYELRLKRIDGAWMVFGETVMPWPDLANAKGFLPPRRAGST